MVKEKIYCKECGEVSNNGTNFCSKICRRLWMRDHNYKKKDWKRVRKEYEEELMNWESKFDIDGNSYPHN